MTMLTGNGGNVTAHGRRWIYERDTGLNKKTIGGVGVVAGPAAREVMEKAWIESTTSTGTAFPQDIWKTTSQVVENAVETEHVAVSSRGRRHLVHRFIAVPLDVNDIGRSDDVANDLDQMILDLEQTEIENVLEPLLDSGIDFVVYFCMERPFWMCFKDLTLWIAVFWFDP